MGKHKLIQIIEQRLFESCQSLSVYTYSCKMDNKYFDFDAYFETYSEQVIKYSLEHLNVDVDDYKPIFRKYLIDIFKLSEENATLFMKIDISNRKSVDDWWLNNKSKFIQDVMKIYSKK